MEGWRQLQILTLPKSGWPTGKSWWIYPMPWQIGQLGSPAIVELRTSGSVFDEITELPIDVAAVIFLSVLLIGSISSFFLPRTEYCLNITPFAGIVLNGLANRFIDPIVRIGLFSIP